MHCRLGRSSSEQTDQGAPERRPARYTQIACKSVVSAVGKRGKDGESVCARVCARVQAHVYECAHAMHVHECARVYMYVHTCAHLHLTCVCACMHTCVIRDTLTENKAGETLEEDAEDEDDADEEDLRTSGERAKASCENRAGVSRAC